MYDNYRAVKLIGRWNRPTLCNRGWSAATPSGCVHPLPEATSERSNKSDVVEPLRGSAGVGTVCPQVSLRSTSG